MEYAKPELLSSKILLPTPAAWEIKRPRLMEKLPVVRRSQVTVLKAGAGFGKTSLASAWASQLRLDGNAVAWISLDREDDEPTAFFFYLAHALKECDSTITAASVSLFDHKPLVAVTSAVSALIDDIRGFRKEIYAFIDDFHCILDAEILDGIDLLLKYAPRNFHVILTTRLDPGLPLARLRSQNRLVEIDASSLAFDLNEIGAFLKQEQLGDLSVSALSLLHRRTEGWPALLRILSVTSSQSGETFSSYIERLTGDLKPVTEFFADLLDGLAPALLEFMMRISVLRRFSEALCASVTNDVASIRHLASLATRHVLLIPLDQEGTWYRFHPLLAEHLSRELQARSAGAIPELHRRAADWLARNELWTEAIHHAIAAGDMNRAAEWIAGCVMSLIKSGDLITLLSWQRLFPRALMRAHTRAKLSIAWGLAIAIRYDEALDLVEETEQEIRRDCVDGAEAFLTECEAIRAVVLTFRFDIETAKVTAEHTVSTATEPWTFNTASNMLRLCHWRNGDLAAFYATPWMPLSIEEEPRYIWTAVFKLCLQAGVEFEQLHAGLSRRYSEDAYAKARKSAGINSMPAALAAALLARIHYEQSRVDEAEQLLLRHLTLINATATSEYALNAYLTLTRISILRQDFASAHQFLESAEHLAHGREWRRMIAAVVLERLRLYLLEGRKLEADATLVRLDQMAAAFSAAPRKADLLIPVYAKVARASVELGAGHFLQAVDIFGRAAEDLATYHNKYLRMWLEFQLSSAMYLAGRREEAEHVFNVALRKAAGAGFTQIVLDQGPIGEILIRSIKLDQSNIAAENEQFIRFCERTIDFGEQLRLRSGAAITDGVPNMLSPREHGILQRVSHGQSNKEIARELGIAAETVKSHIKNIFVKLGVGRRNHAVRRGVELGLLK
ncbi:LuxR C-terminal-related transcriptional regulator [Labrys monachus]|uniref:LuxR family maltose regulon positive regulatory protein n=1 Tax=Labrys monachus TaxID=217067 RepID=A0ABU0F8U4_9HYPH|nr:LuxR C-terminal-related transcriptional regulator [Labrys monachus]MDQ0390871.1 LuxR family maltose regulon positive regulatory protein [Labrys monachus]